MQHRVLTTGFCRAWADQSAESSARRRHHTRLSDCHVGAYDFDFVGRVSRTGDRGRLDVQAEMGGPGILSWLLPTYVWSAITVPCLLATYVWSAITVPSLLPTYL